MHLQICAQTHRTPSEASHTHAQRHKITHPTNTAWRCTEAVTTCRYTDRHTDRHPSPRCSDTHSCSLCSSSHQRGARVLPGLLQGSHSHQKAGELVQNLRRVSQGRYRVSPPRRHLYSWGFGAPRTAIGETGKSPDRQLGPWGSCCSPHWDTQGAAGHVVQTPC